jgi:hypothetical protein
MNNQQTDKAQTIAKRSRMQVFSVIAALILILLILLLSLRGCFSIYGTVTNFPVLNEADIPMFDSQATGELIVKNGYLRLLPPLGSNMIVIWPYGYTWRRYALGIEVLDQNDRVVARTGQIITLGGGFISIEALDNICDPPVPDDIDETYWAANP